MTMTTRYQVRLRFLMCIVAIAALAFASFPYLDWAVRGFPYHDRHVRVTVDGVTYEIDSRVWPDHYLNPKNRDRNGKP
jgi:hypothetical protein